MKIAQKVVGARRENRRRFELSSVVGRAPTFPDASQVNRLAVGAADEVRLLFDAVALPLVKAFGRYDASTFANRVAKRRLGVRRFASGVDRGHALFRVGRPTWNQPPSDECDLTGC